MSYKARHDRNGWRKAKPRRLAIVRQETLRRIASFHMKRLIAEGTITVGKDTFHLYRPSQGPITGQSYSAIIRDEWAPYLG